MWWYIVTQEMVESAKRLKDAYASQIHGASAATDGVAFRIHGSVVAGINTGFMLLWQNDKLSVMFFLGPTVGAAFGGTASVEYVSSTGPLGPDAMNGRFTKGILSSVTMGLGATWSTFWLPWDDTTTRVDTIGPSAGLGVSLCSWAPMGMWRLNN